MALEPPTAALQEFRPPVGPTLRQAGSSRVDSEFCDSVIQPQAMDVGHIALGGPPTRQSLDPSRSRMSLVISTLAIRTQPSLGGNLDRLGFRYTRYSTHDGLDSTIRSLVYTSDTSTMH